MSIARVKRPDLLLFAFLVTAPASANVRSEMLVSTEWLQERLNDSSVVVLHVARDRAHYTAGHIPGACFVPWDQLAVARGGVTNELPLAADLVKLFAGCGVGDDSRIVLYGDNTLLSATRAWFTLDYLGHAERAALLDGGIEKWRAERRPLSTKTPAPRPSRLTPRVRPGVVVRLEQVREFSREAASAPPPQVLLLDSRAETAYRSGHIPGAVNLFWGAALTSMEIPVMKPADEVRRMYTQAGAAPGRTVVAYCGSGVQATHTYFTLKYLGYDVKLYDGSFSEWSKAQDAPVQ
ncbi:MAG: sulfurtransferase [Rhodospirillales bacterium]